MNITCMLDFLLIIILNRMFTQQALRITSCIHETDTDESIKTHSGKKSIQQMQHAGRLLLNHGYLEDALKTGNNAYLNDNIVKRVIQRMWYRQTSGSCGRVNISLALGNVIYIDNRNFS
jgi:hypothetical protein